MKIELIKSPTPEHIGFLGTKLDNELENLWNHKAIEHIGFFIKNDNGNLIGGCNGFIFCSCIYTDQLWIHESIRGKGMGRKLMESMHDYGRKHNCRIATLQTMNFQDKRKFYEHLGYKCDLEREGYANGATLICMKKEL